MRARLRAAAGALRRFWSEQSELQQRMALLDRPWEEEFLHWVGEGDSRRLHGHLPPPNGRRRLSVTSGGWCTGLRRDRLGAIETSGTTAIADGEL